MNAKKKISGFIPASLLSKMEVEMMTTDGFLQ